MKSLHFDKASFAEGTYKFRVDYLNDQFWSGVAAIPQDSSIAAFIEEGDVDVTVRNQTSALSGRKVYLFNEAGAYLGKNATTDANGLVSFDIPIGMNIKLRADNLGYQFWSDPAPVSAVTPIDLLIQYQDVTVTVSGAYQGASNPIEDIKVYLFTSSGAYQGQNLTTEANGQITLSLPERTYKVRADYLSGQYWSDEFTGQNVSINIPMADADVYVVWNSQGLDNVPVYVFNDSDVYLGLNDSTDENGETSFRRPASDYKFRADYLGSQFWSGEQTLQADVSNPVSIYTGGGTFNLTILKDQENPLAGDKTYLFNSSSSYLGISHTTDEHGQVSYDLPQGSYKFRVDTLGYQFWTGDYAVPGALSDVFTILHQDGK